LTAPPSLAAKPNVFAICFIRANGISVPASSAGIRGARVPWHHWRITLPTIWDCSSSWNIPRW